MATSTRIFALIATGMTWLVLQAAPAAVADIFDVRVGYVIPADRTAQSDGALHLQQYLPTVRDWYRDQMERYGFGDKTFRFETEADGMTPLVHVVSTPTTSGTIRADTWGNTISAASTAGLSIWNPSDVWLLVPESHLQQSDGSITGGTALGLSFGSGSDPGVAMGGSDFLFRLAPSQLTNNAPFAGHTVPQIGPFPLLPSVSFPWFEGDTFSSIASSAQGALAHELGHAFGLPHDFRNDSNFHGNLMGNGVRGWRSAAYPQLYPNDDVQLSYASALALSTSRYFNPDKVYTDNTKPGLVVSDSGQVAIADGKLQIDFSAFDTSGLSGALLIRNGDVIGEMKLQGTSAFTSFVTPYFTRDQNDEFTIAIFDNQGNRQNSSVHITPQGVGNLAPQPSLAIFQSTVGVGQFVFLSAANTFDPDNSLPSLLFEWDLNGTGVFTEPSASSTLDASFATPGSRLVTVRVTDPSGAWAISAPLAIKVRLDDPDANDDGIIDISDIQTIATNYLTAGPAGDANYDGLVDVSDVQVVAAYWLQPWPPAGDGAGAAVPEPSGCALSLVGLAVMTLLWGRGRPAARLFTRDCLKL